MSNYGIAGYAVYRVAQNGLSHVDWAATAPEAEALLRDNYLCNSRNGERYAIVALSTGIIVTQFVVQNEPKLVRVFTQR